MQARGLAAVLQNVGQARGCCLPRAEPGRGPRACSGCGVPDGGASRVEPFSFSLPLPGCVCDFLARSDVPFPEQP